jgi:archaeosine synthase
VHEMIVTSPLGIVPRELELFYPAAQYDIPVTGHWDREEVAMVQEMVLHLVAQKYDHVICHLGDEGEFVRPVVDCIDTAGSNPGSKDSLNRLQEKLSELCASYPRVAFGEDRQRTMAAVARFQFGPEAGTLVDGCKVSGSFPYSRMVQGDKQMGMLTPERGMISLTLEGAERILGKGLGWVRVGDFKMEGNLFAVGVSDADPNIRIGDEVALVRGEKVVGVGVAMMFGREMKDSARGEAVRVRHALKM